MPYFAKIIPTQINGIYDVESVIRITQEELNTGLWGDVSVWIQADYNTHGNVHYSPSPPAEPMTPDGGIPIRANYPGIGYTYDSVNDVFYSQRPLDMNGQVCNSWIIGAPTWLWNSPIPYPTDGKQYKWDESTLSWLLVTLNVISI